MLRAQNPHLVGPCSRLSSCALQIMIQARRIGHVEGWQFEGPHPHGTIKQLAVIAKFIDLLFTRHSTRVPRSAPLLPPRDGGGGAPGVDGRHAAGPIDTSCSWVAGFPARRS